MADLNLTEDLLALTWDELEPRIIREFELKQSLISDLTLKEKRREEFEKLKSFLSSKSATYQDVPLKYLHGWEANNIRNMCGYIGAGLGTVAMTVATIALRVAFL